MRSVTIHGSSNDHDGFVSAFDKNHPSSVLIGWVICRVLAFGRILILLAKFDDKLFTQSMGKRLKLLK